MSSRREVRTRLVETKFDVTVYTCDRCGVEGDEGVEDWFVLGIYDLCPDCYTTVLEAMGIGGR